MSKNHSEILGTSVVPSYKPDSFSDFMRRTYKRWRLYVLLLPALIWLVIFCYVPMYGVLIAFKDFKVKLGIVASPWAEPLFKYFIQFFQTSLAVNTIWNTLALSALQLIFGFPIPIIFALLLNHVSSSKLKKTVQTISFAPHFISTVVLISMMNAMLMPEGGWLNTLIQMFNGGNAILFTTRAEYFRPLYILSGIWQDMGFSSIIYIAALTAVSPDLHEAAMIDGATKFQRILHIDLPSMMPTMVTMFILAFGKMFSIGYEKAYLMQNTMNLSTSEIISTYVYKIGLQSAQYSFSTAVGLFNSIINFILLITVNFVSRRVMNMGIF